MKKLRDESQLLDEDFRASIIEEIRGQQNIDRKTREQRKHEVYKDRTRKWVIKDLEKEFVGETVNRMINRAANISLLRKVVNKRARTYSAGVERKLEESAKEQVDLYYKRADMDLVYRKADRYLDLFRNTMIQTVPVIDSIASLREGKDLYKIENRVLAPYTYDVIPDSNNPTEARVVILSEFIDADKGGYNTGDSAQFKTSQGYRSSRDRSSYRRGNGQDEIIAEDAEDDATEQNLRFIWWSHGLHFTTNKKGEIIQNESPEQLENPIGVLPFTKICTDQEGSFWAEGGDDLVDGAILIAKKITDMFTIASIQGWGQPVVSGKNLPSTIAGGPDKLIAFEYDNDEPKPEFQYISSSPPIDLWMKMVEQYTALWLTTNDLAPSTVSSTLSATDFPSGIAQVVENAKHVGSLDEKQSIFRYVEPEVLERNRRWHQYYFDRGLLVSDFSEVTPWAEVDISIEFHASEELQTEDQRLANMKLRKELGIISEVEMIKEDRGIETDEEAEEILLKIKGEKLEKASAFGLPAQNVESMPDSESSDVDEEPESDDEAEPDTKETVDEDTD